MAGCMLAPNEAVAADEVKYPLLVSEKLDGVRCLVIDGVVYSRNLKPMRGMLQDHFEDLCRFSKENSIVLDGELYMPAKDFGSFMSVVTDTDKPVPAEMALMAFDALPASSWQVGKAFNYSFEGRSTYLGLHAESFTAKSEKPLLRVLPQLLVTTPADLEKELERALNAGFEGLIARSPDSPYKFGRGTLNEGYIYKFKEWVTEDAVIVGFVQGTQMKESVRTGDRTRDKLGYLERTSKAETRELVLKIGSINVMLKNGKVCGCGIAKGVDIGLTWENRDLFLNKHVEIRYIAHGVKELPRFAGITRLRPDLDQ